MNKIFRVIWNHATQTWVAVSELQSAKGKTKSIVTVAAAIGIGLFTNNALAESNPHGNSVLTTNENTILIGENATSEKYQNSQNADNIVIGENAKILNSDNSVIIGNNATGGTKTNSVHKDIVAIGYNSSVEYNGGIAIGGNAKSSGKAGHLYRENPYHNLDPNTINPNTGQPSTGYVHPVTGITIKVISDNRGNKSLDIDGDNQMNAGDNTSPTAIGHNALAANTGLAAGSYAVAKNSAVSLGSFAVADGTSSTAIGMDTYARGNTAIAVGRGSVANEDFSIAMGNTAASGKVGSIAMGHSAHASEYRSIAIGSSDIYGTDPTYSRTGPIDKYVERLQLGSTYNSKFQTVASGVDSTAIGALAKATNVHSTALGANALALADNTAAIGYQAKAEGEKATAIGSGSLATGAHSAAIADNALSYGNESLAIGKNTKSLANNTIAIGTGSIAGVASIADELITEIVDKQGELDTARNTLAAIEKEMQAIANELTAAGSTLDPDDPRKQAYQDKINEYNDAFTKVREAEEALDTSKKKVAQRASAENAIAIGVNAIAGDKTALAVGVDTVVKNEQGGAFGAYNTVNATTGIAYVVGTNNTLRAGNTYVFGQNVTTSNENGVILGADSTDAVKTNESIADVGGVKYGSFAGNAPVGIISVGAKDKERQIKNVAAGNISSSSTDAINGSQLYFVMEKIIPGNEPTTTDGKLDLPKTEEQQNRFLNATSVVNAINKSGWKATIGRDENDFNDQVGKTTELINPGETVTFLSGKNLKVKQNGNNITYAVVDNLNLGKNGNDGVDGSVSVTGKDGGTVTLNGKDGSIGLTGPKGKDGKDGVSAKISINDGHSDLANAKGRDGRDGTEAKPRIIYQPVDKNGNPKGEPEQVATLNDGLRFTGDDSKEVKRPLNSLLTVKGGAKGELTEGNIGVTSDPKTGTLNVKLAKDINLGSNGSIKAGPVTINKNGINAGNTRITNVAAGKAPTDAVNVSQLNKATGDIHNRMNKLGKDLQAGIASAMASGNLYHATIPGKSMVAAGVGSYKGQSAVSVGYSRLSDNGKIGVKLMLNTNSRGDSGAAASVGYQW